MKYCEQCNRVYPDDMSKCPEHTYYNDLIHFTTEKEQKCRHCGSTENLLYQKPWKGIYSMFGDEFECKPCKDKIMKEYERQEAMNYFVIHKEEGSTKFYETKEDVEEFLKSYIDDCYDYHDGDNLLEDFLILKVEKIEYSDLDANLVKDKRSLFFYKNDIYTVEEVIEPETEHDGSIDVNW